MCFSPEASFAVGGALIPAGVYCIQSALRKNLSLLPLALVPIAFGVQQLGEGVVWLGLRSEDPALVQKASVFFLFFAIPFWPFWVPFGLLFVEHRTSAKYVLGGFLLLSLVWFWVSMPLFFEPEKWLTTRQMHHSIQYQLDDLPAFRVIPQNAWRVFYLVEICAPFLVGRRSRSDRSHLVGGIAVGVFFLIAYVVFWYAFTSVWCFFAACLSVYLCYVFARLPRPTASDQVAAAEARVGLAK